VLPQIVPFSYGDETTNAGDSASVTCSVVKGDTPIAINWFFNGTEIISSEEITISKISKKVSALTIESARAEHVGEYTCVAKNAAGATNFSSYLLINGLIQFSAV
jgi:Immunoglobulin domain